MPEINLVIEGKRGGAVERFAALAGKTPDQLIMSWIQDRVDHAFVVAERAGGATWESIATELGVSITHARRIYAAGSEFQPVGKEDTKAAEKYLKLLEEIRDVIDNGDVLFPVPTQEDLDLIDQYIEALPDADDIHFPVPTEEDLDALREYQKLKSQTEE